MDLSANRKGDVTGRLLSMTGARLLIWLALGSAQFSGLFVDLDKVEYAGDGHMFYHYEDTARRTLVEYKEAPVWDPYACGGIPGVANPQNNAISPDMALRIAFGTEAGRRLAVFLFFFLGLEGMFHLGRFYGLSALASVFAAMVFTMCGRFSVIIAVGWLNMLTFYLLPAIVLSFEQGLRSWGWRIFGGALLGWTILCAGTYPYPYTLCVLGVMTAVRVVEALLNRSHSRAISPLAPVITVFAMIGLSLLLSAVRLLPLSIVVFGSPRLTGLAKPLYNTEQLISQLLTGFSRLGSSDKVAYIGPLALVLSLLSWKAKAHGVRLMAIVFFVLALGNFAPLSPFTLLSKLPLYNQLRWPDRYLLIVIFYLALAAGYGLMELERLPAYLVRRYWRPPRGALAAGLRYLVGAAGWGLAAAIAIAVAGQLVENNGIRRGLVYAESEPLVDLKSDFSQARGSFRTPHYYGALNLGNLVCNEPTKFARSRKLTSDLAAEEYPLDPSKASVKREAWTPNTITLSVRADAPTRILVNQNYNRNWTASVGKVLSHKGLLAVDLPAGRWKLKLSYRDPYFNIGAIITILSSALVLAFVARKVVRRRRRVRGLWIRLPSTR